MENKQKTKKLSKVAKATLCAVSGLTLAAGAVPTVATIVKNNNEFITVHYSAQNGQSGEFKVNKQTLVSDLKITPQVGYEFKGWYKDEACTQKYLATDVVTANSTIYAKLELVTYAVIFPSSNYFTLTQGSSIVNYGDSISFKINKSTAVADLAETVKVNGTTVTPDANGVYTVSNITSNVVVTIEGLEVPGVLFNVDGVIQKTVDIEEGDTLQDIIDRAQLTITDYNSCGWFANEDLTEVADLTATVTEKTTLYTKTATLDALTFSTTSFSVSDATATEIVVPAKYNNGTSDYTITTISWDSFSKVRDILQSITLPVNITSIYDNSFSSLKNLSQINIPNKVNSINYRAFADCTSLTSINIPNSLTSLGYGIFNGCTNLSYIYWNANIGATGNVTGESRIGVYAGGGYFDGMGSNENKNVTFVIGKDVTKFSAFGIFEGNGSGSATNILEIAKIIFDADETRTQLTSFDACVPGEVVVFDSQTMFNACNGQMYIYDETADVGPVTVYVKQTLTGADSFTAASQYIYTGTSYTSYDAMPTSYTYTTSTATLVTDGEYAGYYMYTVTPTEVS